MLSKSLWWSRGSHLTDGSDLGRPEPAPGPGDGPGNRQPHPAVGSPAAKCWVTRARANSLGPGPGEPYTVSWPEDVTETGPADKQRIRGDDRTGDYQGRGPLKRPDLGEQERRHGGRPTDHCRETIGHAVGKVEDE